MNGFEAPLGTVDEKLANLVRWLCPHDDIHGKNNALAPSRPYISPKIQVREQLDSGRGLYAVASINTHETLVKVSPQFLLNFTTAVRHIAAFNESIRLVEPHYLGLPPVPLGPQDKYTAVYALLELLELVELTSFQLISMYLTLEKQRGSDSWWNPFISFLPQLEDLSMSPLVWKVLDIEADLLDLLPNSTKKHTADIYKRFTTDYAVVTELLGSKLHLSSEEVAAAYLPLPLFLWAWMCINSRCLYMDMPQAKSSADNFTLAPYVDFLNHSCDDQCGIKIDNNGFRVHTTSKYAADSQLFFSYGPHSNEFLLCEYGFMLAANKWNYLNISEYVLPLLKPKQVDFLKEIGYYDDYTISEGSGISFRTEVAFAVLQESSPLESTKLKSLIEGHNDGKFYMKNTRILLKKILEKIVQKCDNQTLLEYADDDGTVANTYKRIIGRLYRDMKTIATKTLDDMQS